MVFFVEDGFRDLGEGGGDDEIVLTLIDLLHVRNEHFILKPVRSDQANVGTLAVLFSIYRPFL